MISGILDFSILIFIPAQSYLLCFRPTALTLLYLTYRLLSRLLFTPIFALVVHWTPPFKQEDGTYPYYYFAIIVLIYCLHQVKFSVLYAYIELVVKDDCRLVFTGMAPS